MPDVEKEEARSGESPRKQCAGGRAACLNAFIITREDAKCMWKRMPGVLDNAEASGWLGASSAWRLKQVFNLQNAGRKPKSSSRVDLDETTCLKSSALWLGAWALFDYCDQKRLDSLKSDGGINAKSYVAQNALSALEAQGEILNSTQADLAPAWHQIWGKDVTLKNRNGRAL